MTECGVYTVWLRRNGCLVMRRKEESAVSIYTTHTHTHIYIIVYTFFPPSDEFTCAR